MSAFSHSPHMMSLQCPECSHGNSLSSSGLIPDKLSVFGQVGRTGNEYKYSDITLFDLPESVHQGCFLIIDETAGGRGYLGVSGCLISHNSRQVCAARPGPDPDIRQKYDRPLSRPALSRHRLSSTLHCPCQARATHLLLLDHFCSSILDKKLFFSNFLRLA